MNYELNMKKKLLVLWMCSLLAPIITVAQGWDEVKYKQIEQSIRAKYPYAEVCGKDLSNH